MNSGALCQELGIKKQILNQEMFPAPITQKVIRVLQALCQKLGAETKPGFLILSQMHMYQREERSREERGGRRREGKAAAQGQIAPSCLLKREKEKKEEEGKYSA